MVTPFTVAAAEHRWVMPGRCSCGLDIATVFAGRYAGFVGGSWCSPAVTPAPVKRNRRRRSW